MSARLSCEVAKQNDPRSDETAMNETSEARSMRHSAEEMRLPRGAFQHTLQFSGLILISPLSAPLSDMMSQLVLPIEESQALAITMCKTRRGGREFYKQAACGAHVSVLVSVLKQLDRFLLGLFVVGKGFGAAGLDMPNIERVSRIGLSLALALIWEHSIARMMYTSGMPFALMRLLCDSPDERGKCLQWCRTVAEGVSEVERRAASGEKWMESFRHALVWPLMHLPGELLLQLEACHFRAIPKKTGLRHSRGFQRRVGVHKSDRGHGPHREVAEDEQ